jgi:hypothetical protein
MSKAVVKSRWKEEVAWECEGKTLVFEMTFGEFHVYFPTIERWQKSAPDFAKSRYEEILDDVRKWSEVNNIPFTIDEQAWMRSE